VAARLLEVNVARIPRLAQVVVPDLAITATPPETFAVKVVGYGVAMALMVPLLAIGAATAGIDVSLAIPVLGVIVLGIGGAALPFIDLHTAAERRRRHFCHSLATYASLVSMAMAGSMGWSSALEAASSVSSTDWAMDEIAQALLWSQAYHRPPWEGLDRLAERFALSDLSDLARSMAQAGDGARIRATLETKAASLRLSETTAAEHDAQAVTQKMLLPGVLLMAGYGVLIFYPALASFTGSHL
jgi:Flp pilus assembly protein TadB